MLLKRIKTAIGAQLPVISDLRTITYTDERTDKVICRGRLAPKKYLSPAPGSENVPVDLLEPRELGAALLQHDGRPHKVLRVRHQGSKGPADHGLRGQAAILSGRKGLGRPTVVVRVST